MMEGEDGEDEWHREQQNDISSALWSPELEGGRGDAWEKRQKELMWRP